MIDISEELFVETLEAIKKGIEERNEFNETIEKFSDGFVVFTLGDAWLNALIKLLETIVDDVDDKVFGSVLSWWLFEDVDKVIYLPPDHPSNPTAVEFAVSVATPQELYRYYKYFN